MGQFFLDTRLAGGGVVKLKRASGLAIAPLARTLLEQPRSKAGEFLVGLQGPLLRRSKAPPWPVFNFLPYKVLKRYFFIWFPAQAFSFPMKK